MVSVLFMIYVLKCEIILYCFFCTGLQYVLLIYLYFQVTLYDEKAGCKLIQPAFFAFSIGPILPFEFNDLHFLPGNVDWVAVAGEDQQPVILFRNILHIPNQQDFIILKGNG